MSDQECKNGDPRLQDFVDGLLGPDDERRVRLHLAVCGRCRREERELRRLLTRVAELPREIAPPRDLWSGVAERLVARRPAAADRGAPARPAHRGAARGGRARRWLLQAAAALAFTVLGALLAQLAGPAREAPDIAGPTAAPPSGRVMAASDTAPGFDEIESEYLRAKEALWLLVSSRQDELSPVTLEIVRRNLIIVDDAIRDLRAALAKDPGNRQLESSLLAQHRRGLHLLHRLIRTGEAESPEAG